MIHPKIVENMTNQQNHLLFILFFWNTFLYLYIRYKDRLEHEHEHEHEHEAEPY